MYIQNGISIKPMPLFYPLQEEEEKGIEVGACKLVPARYDFFVNGTEVQLTRTEFKIMALLMRRPGMIFTREQIVETAWMTSSKISDKTVNMHIGYIRKKIRPRNDGVDPIETVRDIGYKFQA